MALQTTIHDSLPYIDSEPSALSRSAAQSLIDAELLSSHPSTSTPTPTPTHPSLPALPPQNLTPAMQSEHDRIAQSLPLTGIDTSRYEMLSAPTPSPSSTPSPYRALLASAYTSHSYLTQRATSLTLLEQFGKHAWLISNSQLEDLLRGLERELADAKGEIDELAVARRGAQEGVRGEVEGLGEAWRRGVGRVLETEVAAEGVRRSVLERRREGVL